MIWENIMYTRCHRQRICLHSSIFDIASQYQAIGIPYRSGKTNEKGPPGWAALDFCQKACLFRRLLARRIECAGIVDLGDLMVAEAEHLAQDLVGMFAEQR